jgi:hypothetical protein
VAAKRSRPSICESSRGLGEPALEALISRWCGAVAKHSRPGICESLRGLGEPALEALISRWCGAAAKRSRPAVPVLSQTSPEVTV